MLRGGVRTTWVVDLLRIMSSNVVMGETLAGGDKGALLAKQNIQMMLQKDASTSC